MTERFDYGTSSVLQTIVETGRLIASEATWFDDAWNTQMNVLLPYIRSFFGGGDEYPAAATIFNQAVNDYMSLMHELATGSGRSAVRSARSLIEHAVNMGEVVGDNQLATRYMQHLVFTAEFSNEDTLGNDLLDKKDLRKQRRIKKQNAERAQSQISRLLKMYGKGFRRSWTNVDLRTRAERQGLLHLYPAYRQCSLVIHGASSGITGSIKDFSGRHVHRSGPILRLCPLAYISGVEAMLGIAQYCSEVRPDLGETLKHSVIEFRSHWAQYAADIANVDKKLWPSVKPEHATAILGIAANGTHRWFWYDPDYELVIPSFAPESLKDSVRASISKHTQEIVNDPERNLRKGTRFVPIIFDGTVVVKPKPGARTFPASVILRDD